MNAILVGKIVSEDHHPISRPLMKLYHPVVEFVLEHKWKTIAAAVLAMAVTVPIFFKLGSEFMPPLDEGTLLYMPSTMPGISVAEVIPHSASAGQDHQAIPGSSDGVRQGRPGRKRHRSGALLDDGNRHRAQAPRSVADTSALVFELGSQLDARISAALLARPSISTQDLIYGPGGMNDALQIPGIANAWTMPIKARIDMLTTGVRTPLGVKVLGSDLGEIQKIGEEVEMALKDVKGTTSVFAERTTGGYFLDFDLKRDELARYGLTIDAANDVLMSAIGGEPVTTTVEGRERYPVNVRYLRDYRSDLEALQRVLVSTPSGAQIPLAQIADITRQNRTRHDSRRERTAQRLRLRRCVGP